MSSSNNERERFDPFPSVFYSERRSGASAEACAPGSVALRVLVALALEAGERFFIAARGKAEGREAAGEHKDKGDQRCRERAARAVIADESHAAEEQRSGRRGAARLPGGRVRPPLRAGRRALYRLRHGAARGHDLESHDGLKNHFTFSKYFSACLRNKFTVNYKCIQE